MHYHHSQAKHVIGFHQFGAFFHETVPDADHLLGADKPRLALQHLLVRIYAIFYENLIHQLPHLASFADVFQGHISVMQVHLTQIQQSLCDAANDRTQLLLMEEVIIVANRYVSQLVLKIIVVHHQLLCLTASESARLLIHEIIALGRADVRALCQLQSLLQNFHHLLLFRRRVYRQDRVELAVLGDRQRGTVCEL